MDESTDAPLARCHGFRVLAADQPLGLVETPVFSGTRLQPDYLIVRIRESVPGGFADVPVELVDEIDDESRTISLSARLSELVPRGRRD